MHTLLAMQHHDLFDQATARYAIRPGGNGQGAESLKVVVALGMNVAGLPVVGGQFAGAFLTFYGDDFVQAREEHGALHWRSQRGDEEAVVASCVGARKR